MKRLTTFILILLLLISYTSYCYAQKLILVHQPTVTHFNVPLKSRKHIPKLAVIAPSTSSNFTVTITVTPIVTNLTLSSSSYTGDPNNAGAVIGTIQAVTNPVGSTPPIGVLTLGGVDGAKFALSSTSFPSNLMIGANNLVTGSYSITITFTPN